MIHVRRYNPPLKARLLQLVQIGNYSVLEEVLQSLTVVEKRTAGYILSEEILPSLSSAAYWDLFIHLVPTNSKAYLGTFLKAAVVLKRNQTLCMDPDVLRQFAACATVIDKRKFAEALFPHLTQSVELQSVVSLVFQNDLHAVAPFLIGCGTPAAYFVLFRLIKTNDTNADGIHRLIVQLMKSQAKYAFNMAGILQKYFDIREIPGIVSLHLEPYELSCLEKDYESFLKILKR